MKKPKMHLYMGGKTTKCGRPPSNCITTPERADTTCHQCLQPNRPFTYSLRSPKFRKG